MIEHAADPSIPIGNDPATPAARPRIFILSNVRLLCDGLLLALSQQPSVIVTGAADLSTPPARIVEFAPDVLLLDVGTPRALDTSLPCRQLLPALKVVAIAVADIEQDVFACAQDGVSVFVSGNGSIQYVVKAIHCAMRDELACSPRTAALLVSQVAALATKRAAGAACGALTRREQEIVSLVSAGLSNKEIARQLRIQNATVKNHIHSILGKLQVRRRGEIAAHMRGSAPHGWGTASPARAATQQRSP